MKKLISPLIAIMGLFILITSMVFTTKAMPETTVKDFSLLNTDGKQVSLSNYPDAKGFIIVFTCNHCPFAKLYPKRLNEMTAKYKKFGVPVIAISSTDTVTYEEDAYALMVQKSKKEKYKFPYLYDNNQTVAKDFKADKTPHAFVIWKENNAWVVKYNGAIDDNGFEPKKVENPYVMNAVDSLLANKNVSIKDTKSIGCKIYFRQ
jgi:peroxiredoxin